MTGQGSVLTSGGVYLDVSLESHLDSIDFRKFHVRKAMGQIGRMVQFRARRLVARRAISDPDGYPGIDSGQLLRSIGYAVSRSGFLVIVQPKKTAGMREFYPAFLYYGAEGRSRGGDLAPRKNYMIDAMNIKRDYIQRELFQALSRSIKPE